MDVIKNLKKLKVEHVILFLVGAVFLFYLIKSYSTSKVLGAESMNSRKTQEMYNQSNAPQSGGNVEPSQPLGQMRPMPPLLVCLHPHKDFLLLAPDPP